MIPRHSRPALVILAVLTAAVLGVRFVALGQLGLSLYIDEAQYWVWSEYLAWGYFSKPPGVAVLIAASTAAFGDGLVGVKALAMLCYPLAAWLAFFLGRRLYNAPTGLWSAVVVLTLPIFDWLGLFVSTDALLTVFWVLATLCYVQALESHRWRDWWLLGLVCGLGLLSKYTMVAWMLAAWLHLAVYHRDQLRHAGPWSAGLLALLMLGPNVWWNVLHDFPTLKHTADITLNKKAAGGWPALAGFLGAQWLAFGPVFGSAFLLLLAKGRSVWRDPRLGLLLWFALPLWVVVSLQAFKSSANANWAAPAFVPAAMAVVAWLVQAGRLRWLAWGVAANVLLAALSYAWTPLLQLTGVPEASRRDPFTRARGWDRLGTQLQPLLAAQPGAVLVADNRTLLSHLVYETRALRPAFAAWNAQHDRSDHFKLTTDLGRYLGHDVVFVTRDPLPVGIGDYFYGVEPLGRLSTPLDEVNSLACDVYLLRDFKGY